MCRSVKMVPSALFTILVATSVLIGCGQTAPVSVVDDPGTLVASRSDQSPGDTIVSGESINDDAPVAAPIASLETASAVDNPGESADTSELSADSTADSGEPKLPPVREQAPPERIKGLGQFGGGGGGGMMGGMGGGGMGGGGMGGMMGGMGGGGMGGGGGVSIDPKIQLKKDSSGKLDQRRKEATGAKPQKGGFSSN